MRIATIVQLAPPFTLVEVTVENYIAPQQSAARGGAAAVFDCAAPQQAISFVQGSEATFVYAPPAQAVSMGPYVLATEEAV